MQCFGRFLWLKNSLLLFDDFVLLLKDLFDV